MARSSIFCFKFVQSPKIKDKLYAKAGIADYWVLAPQKRQLHIFRKPTSTGYTEYLILSEPSQASLLSFPDVAISLTSILPPIS
jgi:Uma2 family endonuclease